MRVFVVLMICTAVLTFAAAPAAADMLDTDSGFRSSARFPDLAFHEVDGTAAVHDGTVPVFAPALWPFGGSNDTVASITPKSTRKAFFLSLLLPGLGEWYVGSKRSFLFLGVEAFAWYTYLTNNSDGRDLEDEFEAFADAHWHYTDTVTSTGDPLHYNYWEYLKNNPKYDITDDIGPEDYDIIAEHIEGAGESHSLPGSKTQQYYEMIGKYDHFVYGWEDIIDHNPQLLTDGVPNNNYLLPIDQIESPMRLKYMSMRGDSNDKLNAAQRGLYIMMINRVLSAIDAGRLAYKHNKQLDSDLSMVRVRMVQKRIIDNDVPMLMVFKPF